MKKPLDDSYHPPAPNFYTGRGVVMATRANLPHWNREITASFVTFRLADSLPREELLKRLERRGIDLGCEAIGRSLPREDGGEADSSPLGHEAVGRSLPREGESEAVRRPLPREDGGEADSSPLVDKGRWGSALPSASHSAVEDTIQDCLDAGHGSCVLRNEGCRQIVEDALWYFAGERYHLYAYVVMPNHVHVLFQPTEGLTLSGIVASWKKFTARQINDAQGREGMLWQKESFDTLIRSERHFQDVVRYIKKNDLTGAWVAYR